MVLRLSLLLVLLAHEDLDLLLLLLKLQGGRQEAILFHLVRRDEELVGREEHALLVGRVYHHWRSQVKLGTLLGLSLCFSSGRLGLIIDSNKVDVIEPFCNLPQLVLIFFVVK